VFSIQISSGDLTNTPFFRKIAKYNKPIILSTGMSTMGEVVEAVETIYSAETASWFCCTAHRITDGLRGS